MIAQSIAQGQNKDNSLYCYDSILCYRYKPTGNDHTQDTTGRAGSAAVYQFQADDRIDVLALALEAIHSTCVLCHAPAAWNAPADVCILAPDGANARVKMEIQTHEKQMELAENMIKTSLPFSNLALMYIAGKVIYYS